MDIMHATDERLRAKTSGKSPPQNPNDLSLHSRSLSVAWFPATRTLVSVQWGEVWYWSASSKGGPGRGLTLSSQDCHDFRVRSSGATGVAASQTTVFLPPLKRVHEYRGGREGAHVLPASSDVCVLVCGGLPSSLLRISPCAGVPGGGLVATTKCEIEDEGRRRNTGFTCACVAGTKVLVGTTGGDILVADAGTFKFQG
ncbi:hypothetical protein TrRE_jg12969 [Triparma retinervis]|uniref:Uncharacterized protein n=1 Tax=Triparma retinervis TaxID=2557542 RepID=A0A9W7A9X8_9STRA|nr:hypothetical protein TrRE_jg12969 [Triparma retinervis]